MGGACRTKRICRHNLVKNAEGENDWKDLNINESFILKWIVKIRRDVIDCIHLAHMGQKFLTVATKIMNTELHKMREIC